mmetsp:Transcript_29358/g.95601  ORF Transcript_29358/g.95601 Transcript_29358/m.95601 type:complete len:505 (+) Transcript_29358:224-1738(+)
MPSLDVLIVKGGRPLAQVEQLGHKLARVAGVHAVVARRRGDEDGRVGGGLVQVVVRRVALQEGPVVRVWVAVLAHPARPCEELVEAAHVEQRHLAHDGAEERAPRRRPREHVAREQSAVGAALAAELRWRGDTARDQVACDRLEVLVRLAALLLERGLVPARAVLASAADVRLHVRVSLLEPRRADTAGVARREADLEAAVPVEQRRCRAVERQPLLADEEVGHPRPVGRRGEELLRLEAVGVEEGGQRLERLLLERRARVRQRQRGRLRVARRRRPDRVARLGVDGGEGGDGVPLGADRLLERPRAGRVAPEAALVDDVLQHAQHEARLGGGGTLERAALRRGEERHQQRPPRLVAVRIEEGLERRREQSTRLVPEPRRSQRDQQLVGEGLDVGVLRDGHLAEGAVGPPHLVRRRVEGDGARPQLVPMPAVEVGVAGDGDVALLALVHLGRLAEWRAAPPLVHRPRVAAVRHLLLAKDSADEQRVAVLVRELALRLGQLEAAV